MKRFLTAIALAAIASLSVTGYAPQSVEGLNDPKATPAYEVVVLRKAAVEAELAHLLGMFTSRHPSVESKRAELSVVSREMETMRRVHKSLVPKLSSTYGNLILRKVALEVELKALLIDLTPQHPDIKRKKVEIAALERETERILQ